MDDEDLIITTDQLPADPMAMPPPYWRGGGAIFYVMDSVAELVSLLQQLRSALDTTHKRLKEFEEASGGNEVKDDDFVTACGDLWGLEYSIRHHAHLAIFMSAIQAEDDINRFCVFNLPKHVVESIEKLAPPDKLVVAAAGVQVTEVKTTAVFEKIKRLTAWRNAFAHGHCVDRPTTSLRHNHLISPPNYPNVPDVIPEAIRMLSSYVDVSDYLQKISINPYTKGVSEDVMEIRGYLLDLSRFRFELCNPPRNEWYSIIEYSE